MFVCICRAVTEQQVASAIESGALTREAVSKACRAGGDCGACHGMIEAKIEDHLECDSVAQVGVREVSADASGPHLVRVEALKRLRRAG